tara:strand:- start:929 stop:1591 length:663 start_codon:yes stop_codon:yes gene_type:complete
MSKHYFSHLPDFGYKNPLTSSNTNSNYVLAKNIFRRVKMLDDALADITFLNYYTISEGETPQDVAEELYGNLEYDWIVLVVANIMNVRDEWPMSNRALWKYCDEKYGGDLNATQFYETREVRDAEGRLILPAGKVVDRSFTIPDPDTHNINLSIDSDTPLVIGISNWLAETRNNENKRNIKTMKPEYLTTFLLDMRNELFYKESSTTIDKTTKIASNPDL